MPADIAAGGEADSHVEPRPQWIAKMYAGKVGRDHLGLGSVSSDQILPTLAPTINVITDHPRYHSFYTFLLHEFWERDRPRSRSAWVRFFRPREFIFSVGTHLCDRPEHGDMPAAVGSQRTEGLARRALASYDTTFNYIKSDLGGYGLYYRSVMAGLGLIYPGGRGFPYPVDVPTERGKEVAEAFRQEIEDTAYYRDYFAADETQVPIDVVRDYIRSACLCQLRRTDAKDHPLVLDSFLHAGGDRNAELRRQTFRFLLDVAAQTEGHGIGEGSFRQLVYFGATDGGATYGASPAVGETARRWRLYQAREYYAFALNALWCHLCDWGIASGGAVSPLPLDDLWAHLDQSLDIDPLAAELGLEPPGIGSNSSFDALMKWVEDVAGAGGDHFDAACTIATPVNESRLYLIAKRHRSEGIAIAAALTLLAALALRFDSSAHRFRPEWEIARMGADGRLSFDGFLRSLARRRQTPSVTVSDVATWLYRDYVILQHELVALTKLPENTFRFRREGGRLRFFGFDNPLEFNNSRFGALTTTLGELGLCGDIRKAAHPLSVDGVALFTSGDLS